MAVGTLIEGVVADKVATKKGAVLIPADSPVRGALGGWNATRIGSRTSWLHWSSRKVELQGIRYHFFADVEEIESAPSVEQTLIDNSSIRVKQTENQTPITPSGSRAISETPAAGRASMG
jgi:hypothetical protein